MGKFTLFDFLSFVLPGGTFIGILIELIHIPHPTITKTELFVIPFLVIAYLLGHLFSILGLWIEQKTFRKHPFWMDYLIANKDRAKQIDECSHKKLNTASFIDNNGEILKVESGTAYDSIYAFLELEEKDSKIKTLMAQYGFFRNISGVWFILILTQMTMLALKLFNIIELKNSLIWNWSLALAFLLALLCSIYLLKQRKSLVMKFVYHSFLVYTSKS